MSISRLPATGVASYNGFTFSAALQTVGADIKTVWDSADREIIYRTYRLRLQDYVDFTGEDVNRFILGIKNQLMTGGGKLRYTGKGLGDLQINVGAGTRDVRWGPKPRSFNWTPVGNNRTIKFVWEVEFSINECPDVKHKFEIMEFCFTVEFKVDNGFITRTLNGHFRIPQSKATVDATALTDNADNYWERFYPPPLDGFKRHPVTRKLSEDKCELTFTVIDEQLKRPLEEGVIERHMTYDLKAKTRGFFLRWLATLEAEYELAPGINPGLAWEYFKTVMVNKQSLNRQIRFGKFLLPTFIIPESFSLHEPDVGDVRRIRFSTSWTFAGTLDAILTNGGQWRRVPGTNHTKWTESMIKNRVYSPLGYRELRFKNEDDSLVSLCIPKKEQKRKLKTKPVPDDPQINILRTLFPCPPPESSWIYFWNTITVKPYDPVIPIVPLDVNKEVTLRTVDQDFFNQKNPHLPSSTGGTNIVNSVGEVKGLELSTTSKAKIEVQIRSVPVTYIYMTGFAVRACYDPIIPTLKTFFGIKVIPANDDSCYTQLMVMDNVGFPLILAQWRLRFLVVGVPGKVERPPSPLVDPGRLETSERPGSVLRTQPIGGNPELRTGPLPGTSFR